jgi:hypothetical protein
MGRSSCDSSLRVHLRAKLLRNHFTRSDDVNWGEGTTCASARCLSSTINSFNLLSLPLRQRLRRPPARDPGDYFPSAKSQPGEKGQDCRPRRRDCGSQATWPQPSSAPRLTPGNAASIPCRTAANRTCSLARPPAPARSSNNCPARADILPSFSSLSVGKSILWPSLGIARVARRPASEPIVGVDLPAQP